MEAERETIWGRKGTTENMVGKDRISFWPVSYLVSQGRNVRITDGHHCIKFCLICFLLFKILVLGTKPSSSCLCSKGIYLLYHLWELYSGHQVYLLSHSPAPPTPNTFGDKLQVFSTKCKSTLNTHMFPFSKW